MTERVKYLHVCTNVQMSRFDDKARFFKALGDPIRLSIIKFLMGKRSCACICELSKHTKRDTSVVFRHVKTLVQEGIVSAEKQGSFLMCCIKDPDKIKRLEI